MRVAICLFFPVFKSIKRISLMREDRQIAQLQARKLLALLQIGVYLIGR
jgi:hypothetical protein